jgi:hypothetical protein
LAAAALHIAWQGAFAAQSSIIENFLDTHRKLAQMPSQLRSPQDFSQ